MPHGCLPDQRECVLLGQRVMAHDLKHGREHHAAGADAVLQPFDVSGVIEAPLRGVEGNHQCGVKSGGAQRFHEEGGRLQIEQPFQPARGLDADQRNDRGVDLPARGGVALDRNGVGVEHDDVDRFHRRGEIVGIVLGDRHAEPAELAAQNRHLALVPHYHQRAAAADRKGRGSRHFTTRRWVARFIS
jgi:hypothetical protein